MGSLYWRQFMLSAGMVLLTMVLLGVSFYALSYNYTVSEKRGEMRDRANLIAQLTAPVRWTYIVRNMLSDGVTEFTELGPGSVLQGLIRKVDPNAVVESKSTL